MRAGGGDVMGTQPEDDDASRDEACREGWTKPRNGGNEE